MSKHLPQTGTIVNDKLIVSGRRYLVDQKSYKITMMPLSKFKIIRKMQMFFYKHIK